MLLSTHFHLLVRSMRGDIGEVMRFVTNSFVRWYNRGRRRDGPLFRGRFLSRRVDSLAYLRAVLQYIDGNPVRAGLSRSAAEFPHGSAHRIATGRVPRWLSTDVVDSFYPGVTANDPDACTRYAAQGLETGAPHMVALVESRLNRASPAEDPLDDLVGAAPEAIQRWMRQKASIADGCPIRTALIPPDVMLKSVREAQGGSPHWTACLHLKEVNLWTILEVGLLRQMTGARVEDVARMLEIGNGTVSRRETDHVALLTESAEYCQTAVIIVTAALGAVFGGCSAALSGVRLRLLGQP